MLERIVSLGLQIAPSGICTALYTPCVATVCHLGGILIILYILGVKHMLNVGTRARAERETREGELTFLAE